MLPDEVVSVSRIGSFKRLLDVFWCDRDLHYNYNYSYIIFYYLLYNNCSYSTRSHNVINNSICEVHVVIYVYNRYVGQK